MREGLMRGDPMVTIDGAAGEGGGQILRTALALAMVTGKPFRIENIRAARSKPGLLRQHLTAVDAAASISSAKVTGAELGSRALTFHPGAVRAGDYAFAVGTAGSATLVLQTVLPALLLASGPSKLTLEGGTHNPAAPPFDFLAKTFLPIVNRMGPTVTVELERPGFYPAGGGRFHVSIIPATHLKPIEMMEMSPIRNIRARAMVANLPRTIADRELKLIGRLLSLPDDMLIVEQIQNSFGQGNVVMIEVERDGHAEIFTGFGEVRVRAEAVAAKVVEEARAYIGAGAPVSRCLADQLLVPMAIAGAGRFRTGPLSRHTTTNIEVIRQFLDLEIELVEEPRRGWTVAICQHVQSTGNDLKRR
jgi:RNA 3'-terminal phosphate cyclase (ATP)